MASQTGENELDKSSQEPGDFNIFTSIRYDTMLLQSQENQSLCFLPQCPLYMAVFHRDRMLEAAHYFGFKANISFLEDGKEFQKQITDAAEIYLKDNNLTDKSLRVNGIRDWLIKGLLAEIVTGESCLR
jgi:hypothetical protein